MSFLRPAALALLRRWFEPAEGAALILFGFWIFQGGGWISWALGSAVMVLGAGWLLLALRRMRFRGDPAAPGIVEIDEGRLSYLHPRMGGEISLNDLAELHLVSLRGRRAWRLGDLSGRWLLVPLDAAGAEALFDAFASLPGLGSAGLVAALDEAAPVGGTLPAPALRDRLVWARQGTGLRRV